MKYLIGIKIDPRESDDWSVGFPITKYLVPSGQSAIFFNGQSTPTSDFEIIDYLNSYGTTSNSAPFLEKTKTDTTEVTSSHGIGGLAKTKDFTFSLLGTGVDSVEFLGCTATVIKYDLDDNGTYISETIKFKGQISKLKKEKLGFITYTVKGILSAKDGLVGKEGSTLFFGNERYIKLKSEESDAGNTTVYFDPDSYNVKGLFIGTKNPQSIEYFPIVTDYLLQNNEVVFGRIGSDLTATQIDSTTILLEDFAYIEAGFETTPPDFFFGYIPTPETGGNVPLSLLRYALIETIDSTHGLYSCSAYAGYATTLQEILTFGLVVPSTSGSLADTPITQISLTEIVKVYDLQTPASLGFVSPTQTMGSTFHKLLFPQFEDSEEFDRCVPTQYENKLLKFSSKATGEEFQAFAAWSTSEGVYLRVSSQDVVDLSQGVSVISPVGREDYLNFTFTRIANDVIQTSPGMDPIRSKSLSTGDINVGGVVASRVYLDYFDNDPSKSVWVARHDKGLNKLHTTDIKYTQLSNYQFVPSLIQSVVLQFKFPTLVGNVLVARFSTERATIENFTMQDVKETRVTFGRHQIDSSYHGNRAGSLVSDDVSVVTYLKNASVGRVSGSFSGQVLGSNLHGINLSPSSSPNVPYYEELTTELDTEINKAVYEDFIQETFSLSFQALRVGFEDEGFSGYVSSKFGVSNPTLTVKMEAKIIDNDIYALVSSNRIVVEGAQITNTSLVDYEFANVHQYTIDDYIYVTHKNFDGTEYILSVYQSTPQGLFFKSQGQLPGEGRLFLVDGDVVSWDTSKSSWLRVEGNTVKIQSVEPNAVRTTVGRASVDGEVFQVKDTCCKIYYSAPAWFLTSYALSELYTPDNPVSIIYSLIKDKLNISDSGIDLPAFTFASEERSGWKAEFTVDSPTSINGLIDKLAKEHCLFVFEKQDGKVSIVPLDPPKNYSVLPELGRNDLENDFINENFLALDYLISELDVSYAPTEEGYSTIEGFSDNHSKVAKDYLNDSDIKINLTLDTVTERQTARLCAAAKQLYHSYPSRILTIVERFDSTQLEIGSWFTLASGLGINTTDKVYLPLSRNEPLSSGKIKYTVFEFDWNKLNEQWYEVPVENINDSAEEIASGAEQIEEVPSV